MGGEDEPGRSSLGGKCPVQVGHGHGHGHGQFLVSMLFTGKRLKRATSVRGRFGSGFDASLANRISLAPSLVFPHREVGWGPVPGTKLLWGRRGRVFSQRGDVIGWSRHSIRLYFTAEQRRCYHGSLLYGG